MTRFAQYQRTTKETDIAVEINIDGKGQSTIDTGIPFMDHMLTLFAKHGLFDLVIRCKGDLEIDGHHTMEDLGLTLGVALKNALGDKASIRRYGHTLLPMDESLALVALDLSGRPFLVWDVTPPATHINGTDVTLFREFFRALCTAAGINLHIQLIKGDEVHHVFEAIFKGFAKALDQATLVDERIQGVLSTKGTLE